ncbi:MAG: PAS and helix-turn-helix domain-containing protein [Pseudomonadota bacterium]
MDVDFEILAFEHAPVGIVLTEKRVIRACNETFASMLGYEKQELINQSFRMLYQSREEFDRMRDIGIEPLKSEGIYLDERIMTRRDGEAIWCRFRAQTLTPDSPLERSILSFALITDRAPTTGLSFRERQVATHLSQGRTSKEIGKFLQISPRTVEDVRSRLLKKFKSKNTAELLANLIVFNR